MSYKTDGSENMARKDDSVEPALTNSEWLIVLATQSPCCFYQIGFNIVFTFCSLPAPDAHFNTLTTTKTKAWHEKSPTAMREFSSLRFFVEIPSVLHNRAFPNAPHPPPFYNQIGSACPIRWLPWQPSSIPPPPPPRSPVFPSAAFVHRFVLLQARVPLVVVRTGGWNARVCPAHLVETGTRSISST